jgi:hypothetical protein
MTGETRTYRFGYHPNHGFLGSLSMTKCVGIATAFLIGAFTFSDFPVGSWVIRLGLAVVFAAIILTLSLWRFFGLTPLEWRAIATRYHIQRARGMLAFQSNRHAWGTWGETITPPVREKAPKPQVAPRMAICVPAELSDVEILETTCNTTSGSFPMGVAKDKLSNTYTACFLTGARSFALDDYEEQERRLDQYGQFLASLAGDDTQVSRVAWYERTVPASSQELLEHIETAKAPDTPEDHLGLLASRDLVYDAGRQLSHEVYTCIQIDAGGTRGSQLVKRRGGGDKGSLSLIAEEGAKFVSGLVRIDVLDPRALRGRTPAILDARRFATTIRDGLDPFGRLDRGDGVDPTDFGQTASRSTWGNYRVDGSLHATGYVREWPHSPVRSDFLGAMLNGQPSAVVRTVALVMNIVPPTKAQKRAERSLIGRRGDHGFLRKIGKTPTAKQERLLEAAASRERELTYNHEMTSFAGYIAVSVPIGSSEEDDQLDLDSAFRVMQGQAGDSRLKLQRLYGQQPEGLTFTLPLCRGLKVPEV